MHLTIPYVPHKKQEIFHAHVADPAARVVAMISAAGVGKSLAGIAEIGTRKVFSHGYGPQGFDLPWLGIVMEPTLRQARQVAIPMLMGLLSGITDEHGRLVPLGRVLKSFDKTDLVGTYLHGAQIMFLPGDDPHKLYALRPDVILMDEARSMSREVYELALTRLAYRNGQLLVTTTPEGYDWTAEIEAEAERDPAVRVVRAIWSDNPNYPAAAVEEMKKRMTAELWEQEFLARRYGAQGRVYPQFSRETHAKRRIRKPEYGVELIIGMDFNVDPMTAVIGFRIGDTSLWFDELVLPGANTWDMSRALTERGYRDHGYIYCDFSGGQRKSSQARVNGAYLTDIRILKQAGFRVKVTPNPAVRDRVASLQARLKNMSGEVNLYICPYGCPRTVEALEKQCFDEKGAPDKTNGFDHFTDALGYPVHRLWPATRKANVSEYLEEDGDTDYRA